MKLLHKNIILGFLAFTFAFPYTYSCVYARETTGNVVETEKEGIFKGMTEEEQQDAAGEYFKEIIKFINENYVGGTVSTETLLQAAIKGMTGELDDYSDYLTVEEYEEVKKAESGVYYTSGIECEFSEDDYPKITSIDESGNADAVGLKTGDTIISIDGISTYGVQQTEFLSLTTKSELSSLKILYNRNGKNYSCDLPMMYVKIKSVERIDMSQMANKNSRTGYVDTTVAGIKISAFAEGTASEFKTMMQQVQNEGATKLIIDLRGNTGGYVNEAIEMCKLIVPAGLIISARDKKGNSQNYMSTLYGKPFEKITIIVDGMTASASEIVASAMQESGAAKIIGENTYGKGIMQSVTDFSELGVIKMTTYEYYTRTGKKINGVGVTPDITVGKVLFVSEEDEPDSEKVKAALDLLGYPTGSSQEIMRSIGKFQALNNIEITYDLNQKTISAINIKIYTDMLTNDRTLKTAYLDILS